MIYSSEEHLNQIRKQFRMLLAEKGVTLRSFCLENDLTYQPVYNRLFVFKQIPQDKLQEWISLLDPSRKVFEQNGKIVIGKPY